VYNLEKGEAMNITSIEKNKKNKDRLSVYVDNQYCFTISEDDYLSLNLYEKKEMTKKEIDYIKNNINFHSAKSTAIKFLSLRLRTEKEVFDKLGDKGYDTKTIMDAIEELKSLGYINNKLYVQKYIYDRSKLKPKSKKMLKFELISKGISQEDIDEIIVDWKADDITVAETLVKKKFGKYDLKDEKIVKRVYSFLHHRGFSFEIVNGIIQKTNNGSSDL